MHHTGGSPRYTRSLAFILAIALVIPLLGCGAPTVRREAGEMPNLAAMIGETQRVAESMMGEHEKLDEEELGPSTEGRFRSVEQAYYVLPDLAENPDTSNLTLSLLEDGTVEYAELTLTQVEAQDLLRTLDAPSRYAATLGLTSVTSLRDRDVQPVGPDVLLVWYGIGEYGGQTYEWDAACFMMSDGTSLGADILGGSIRIGKGILPSDLVPSRFEESSGSSSNDTEDASSDADADSSEDEGAEGAEMGDVPTAKDLGGISHEGETLWFVVAASETMEGDAWWRISDALPLFGDTQMYFIVEDSSHIQGFEPGLWVVVEAYRDKEHAESGRDWALRAFEDAYIKQGTVTCGDPIPVVEDLVEGY
ncbi:MAG: hypothetical protein VB139_02620 [Coriobacteriia bacterium]|nr:hypothetical protein [Coriobacteriia bacterium]